MSILKQVVFSLIFVSSMACYKAPTSNSTQSQSNDVSNRTISSNANEAVTTSTIYAEALEAFNAKQFEKAEKGFKEVTKRSPNNFDGFFYLGKSLDALKRQDDAIRAYRASLAIKPEHGEANLNAGLIEHNRKNYQDAEPFLEQAAKTDYKSPKTLMALADNQRMLKMYDRAIVQYGKVIGFEPNNAEAYYGLGLTYIGLKNKIGARQQLQKLEPLNKELAKKLSDAIGA